MSNQPPRPFVAPGEYDRNRDTIASYRAYLDIYEQMNEQGLRNHEELERMEQMLQDQIRHGEEAKRQLMHLRQSGVRRITDGQLGIPDMNIWPPQPTPVIVPNMQAPSSSAYIEEVQEPRVPTNDHANYIPHSVARHTYDPQPSYYNQQQQHPPTGPSYHDAQYHSPIQRHIPTPPQPSQPSVHTVPYQHPQGHHANIVAQQAAPHNHYPPQIQSQNTRRAQPTLTPEQLEHYRQLEHQKQLARQAAISQQTTAGPPRYYPPAHESNVPTRTSAPNPLTVPTDEHQRQDIPRNMASVSSQQRTSGNLNQVQGPPNAPSPVVISISTPDTNTRTRTVSSLDGALGSGNVHATESTPIHVSTTAQSTAPTNTSLPLVSSSEGIVKATPPGAISSSPGIDAFPQSIHTSSVIQIPAAHPSANTRTHNSLVSPMRTPKDVDKKHLARDILRALKRPRPESSSITEPEPKRHAPESATTELISNVASAITQPVPSSSTTTSPPLVKSTTPAEPPAIQSRVPPVVTAPPAKAQLSVPPPDLPSQPAAAQSTASSVKHSAPTSATPSYSLTATQTRVVDAFLQKYPNTLNPQTLAQIINRYTSVGHSSGQVSYPSMAGGNISQKPPSPPPQPELLKDLSSSSQISYASMSEGDPKPPPQHQPELLDVARAAPVARVPLQPLQSVSARAPDQPQGSPSRPSTSNQVGRQVSASGDTVPSSAPPPTTTNATAFAPTVVSQATSSSNSVVIEGPQSTRVAQASIPITDKSVTPKKTTPPAAPAQGSQTPLFLPSPTSSPRLGTSSVETEEVTAIVLSGNKDKGKAKAISPPLSPSPPLPLATLVKKNRSETAPGSRRVRVYVSVPPLPKYVEKWKKELALDDELGTIQQEFDGLGVMSRSRSPSLGVYAGSSGSRSPVSYVPSQVEESESDTAEEQDSWNLHFTGYDIAEEEVLYENCSILGEVSCRWSKCEVVLNSAGAALRHLDIKHGPRRIHAESPWTCEWMGCGYTCISKDGYRQHIERHAVYPLWCPFVGCNETFRTPRQLVRHKRSDHSNDIARRPTAVPSNMTTASTIPSTPPLIPKILPTYMIEYSCIQGASISRQRHEVIMPGILRRISGNVPTQLHSYNAARPMPMTPSGNHTLDAPAPANTPYSFLRNRSTRYSSYLSTPAKSRKFSCLDSSYVTNLVRRGLVLWPEGDGEAISEKMVEELEDMEDLEEDAVQRELMDGEDAEGHDVFGPTIKIEAPGSGVGGDVGGDGSGVSGSSRSPADRRVPP